jgi:hypothetical protein
MLVGRRCGRGRILRVNCVGGKPDDEPDYEEIGEPAHRLNRTMR